MEIYPMLTGSQLRQYLHISTRKLKYLMDHNYIPHEDTGQATYRYRVRWEDAVEFKRRMEEGARLSWGAGGTVQLPPSAQAQAQAGAGFPAHAGELPTFPTVAGPALGKRAGRPAHPAAAKLLGRTPQTLHRWVKLGKLPAAQVGRFQYCPKGELLRFFGHPGAAAKLPGAAAPVFGPGVVNGHGRGRARSLGFWLFLRFLVCQNPWGDSRDLVDFSVEI